MKLSPAPIVAALIACLAIAPAHARRQTPPAASDNLVSVDVAVLDAAGRPAVGLTAEDFDLSLDGQPKRVVSAQFFGYGGGAATPPPERLFALAIDLTRFSPSESIGMTVMSQGFVDRIPASDKIAVFTYPDGKATDPTTDPEVARRALEDIAGRRAELPRPGMPAPPQAVQSPEEQAADRAKSLAGLRDVLERMRSMPGRKIVVLVTPSRDSANGVPETRDVVVPAQLAAGSDVITYTLWIDTGIIDLTIPEKERPIRPAAGGTEEIAFARWLDTLSMASGGRLVRVSGVNPEPAFNRVLSELSGYYTLRVDAGGAADTRAHALTVKTRQTGLTVRARSFAVFSGAAPNAVPPVAASAAASEDARSSPAVPSSVNADRSRPSGVSDPILSAFERGQYAAAQQGIAQAPDMAKWIREFRNGKTPWPNAPRRTAVFALEVLAVAFTLGDAPARDEAMKLLMQQAATMRSGRALDNFECGWYWGGLMLFEGSDHPDRAVPLAAQAMARCRDEPRITLANAVLLDVSSPVLEGGLRVGASAEAEKASHNAVLAAYEAARKLAETEVEARVREAWFLHRLKRDDDAVKILGTPPADGAAGDSAQGQIDAQIRYYWHLVQGHILRAMDRRDEAVAAYRRAIDAWPQSQVARVSLMTLLATGGRMAEASALAGEIERSPEDAADPWWWFWSGDRPVYPLLINRLRGVVQ